MTAVFANKAFSYTDKINNLYLLRKVNTIHIRITESSCVVNKETAERSLVAWRGLSVTRRCSETGDLTLAAFLNLSGKVSWFVAV